MTTLRSQKYFLNDFPSLKGSWSRALIAIAMILFTSGLLAEPLSQDASPSSFVNVTKYIPGIVVDSPYASAANFLHTPVYAKNVAYLRRSVADRLARVQEDLAAQGYGLKVLDAYRPLGIQKKMWKILPDPRYVADPEKGSKHNRGAAVDVTLVDANGREMEMPTKFDEFSKAAHIDSSAPTEVAGKHRKMLQDAMTKQGFAPLNTEWWHYDAPDWQKYPVEDVSFEQIEAGTALALEDEAVDAQALLARVRKLEDQVAELTKKLTALDQSSRQPAAVSNAPRAEGVELHGQTLGK